MPDIVLLENKHFQDFNPLYFDSHVCPPSLTYSRIRRYYMLHYVYDGFGTFTLNGQEYKAKKNQLFISKPNEVISYRSDEHNPWKHIWIGFDGNMAKKFDDFPPVIDFDDNIFWEMFEVCNMQTAKEEFLAGKLFTLYVQLFGKAKEQNNNYANIALSYINSNFMDNIKISSIASEIGIDRRYLAFLFKNEFGISMQEYLSQKRMNEAKKLLRLGYSVSEACYLSGHNDPANFSKAFKKRFGTAPKNFV